MKINLRFGMHRDVELIHLEKDLIDGLVIPAHILAHQSTSTSVFVTSISDKPYVIDPMTYILQSQKNVHLNDSGDLRPSIEKICDQYLESLAETILDLPSTGTLGPDDFEPLVEFCQNVLTFQQTFVATSSSTSKANKYIKRYSKTVATSPRLVIPPYFCFAGTGDEWYELSLACANATRKLADNVAPVICCQINSLTSAGIKKIQGDYAKFKTLIVWVDNLAEGSTPSDKIKQVRSLIASLSKGAHLESLYGGYLAILMKFDGLSALSHGILYTQHKWTATVPGGGGAPERYYIPAIHDFRSLSQTDLILHKHPELICTCEICDDTLGGDPDNFIRFQDDPELLRQHFLAVRRLEADDIESATAEKAAAKLRQVFAKYHSSFQSLPNPDAFVSAAPMQGLDYLNHWAAAFDPD